MQNTNLDNIPASGWELLDVGEKTIELICSKLEECKTLVWNGPLGVFEMKPFDNATNKVAEKAAEYSKSHSFEKTEDGIKISGLSYDKK